MSTIHDAYASLINVLKDLGSELPTALAVQHEAPPGHHPSPDPGPRNPTLDVVMDPRRSALSDEILATATALRQARALLDPHCEGLRRAVARWEGQEGPDAP